MIRIIAIGKKHEKWISEGVYQFEKRLKKPFNIKWEIINSSNHIDKDLTKDEETTKIITLLKPEDFVILLDERGKNISSVELATVINEQFNSSNNIVFIIGGAFGVSDHLFSRANFILSFSKLVFPHQLVRLMITEQIYRSQNILEGGKYHHL